MPHPVFHALKIMGVSFYSRECPQFQSLVVSARQIPDDDPERFVLNYQAEMLYRTETWGEG